jgi:hypothetical protein
MGHREVMRQVSYSKLGFILLLTSMTFCIQAQTQNLEPNESKAIFRIETIIPEQEDETPSKPVIAEIGSVPVDCDQKYPIPEGMKIKQGGQEEGALVCARLVLQGQRLRCEVEKLTSKQSNMGVIVSTKTELTNWVRCNEKISSLLIDGFYLPASEIERRLQVCRANFYVDQGKPQKLGTSFFERLLDLVKEQFMDLVNRIDPRLAVRAESEPTIQLPATLQNQESTAGLMKCEWMFATSKTPQIDPLPSLAPEKAIKPASPAKAPVKKTSN